MIPAVDAHLAILAVLPISFIGITAIRQFIKNRQNRPPLPPGPMPLPLLGNVLSINTKEPWLTYTQWRATYGDLIFVRILDQDVVVINSQPVAEALMDKRSRNYSDRPYLATLEPYGWLISFAFIGYGDEWRLARRLFHQTFRPESSIKSRPMQMRLAREMVINLMDDPQHYHSHFATFTSSVAMLVIYEYQPSTRDDPLVRVVGHAQTLGLTVLTPERALLLKTFPFLLRLPDWCWGSSMKRDAQASTDIMNEMANVPFQYAQQNMAENTQSSMVARNLQRMEKQDEASKPMFETAVRRAATSALIGSYETVTSTLAAFALAMVSYPDVQRRAQAEIDSVTGRDRLPTFEDRASLPYVESVMRETYRWHPVAPIGVPHAASSDDIYDGYFIPKGASVVCNTWGISRDEKRYPEPSRFMPERFMDVNGALTDDNPADYIFGLGRRGCPGKHTADGTVWSAIVTVLATLDISSPKDDHGGVINFTPQFTTGLSQYLVSLCHYTLLSLTVSSL
ncbi:cytochrome P450 [Suillus ampliporus]|nr:cytochrome P450 [Suillus ampliporus]